MERPVFIVGLRIMHKLLSILRPLSISLQAKGADLVHALTLIDGVKDAMVRERATGFTAVFNEVELLAEKMDIEITLPRLAKGKSVYRRTAGDGESAQSYYRVNAYNPAFDAVMQDLQERFAGHQKKSMSLVLLLPKNCQAYNNGDERTKESILNDLGKVFDLYEPLLNVCATKDQFIAEFKVWSMMWKDDVGNVPESALATLNACPSTSFPTIHKMITILATLPVSTAEAERTFSKVTRTLTTLRSSMNESRLEALIMIESNRNDLPTNADIIERFRTCSKRRMKFGLQI